MAEHPDPPPSGEATDWQAVHDAMLDASAAMAEHFGDRDPSEEEVRSFLRQRLLAQGRSEEEVDAVLRGV